MNTVMFRGGSKEALCISFILDDAIFVTRKIKQSDVSRELTVKAL